MGESLIALLIVAVGVQLALQAPVNNRLGDSVGRLAAALVSNTVGTAILIICFFVVLALGKSGGSSGPGGLAEIPAWQLIGGLIGGLWVAVSAIAVGRVGAGTVAAAAITGQLISAVVIDRFGLLGLERHPATALRLAGVVCLVLGTVLVARREPLRLSGDGSLPSSARPGGQRHLGMIALILAVGLAMGFQHPLNALLSDTVGDFTSALMNFVTGTVMLLLMVALAGRLRGIGAARKAPPVYLLGGLFGVITVLASLAAVKAIGATVLFAALITGQLCGSVLLDRFGAFGLDRRPLTARRTGGLLLLLAGTALVVA
ncbi:MAG: DMT family transporter [Solirubrobacterales bacterium]|nr:DMT family transporter [Solirubrobacterales bacterium]